MEMAIQDVASKSLLDAVSDGDRIEVRFDPPIHEDGIGEIAQARGPVRRIVGRTYLMDEMHRKAWAMSPCLELDTPSLCEVTLLATADEIRSERARKARGEIVFPHEPSTAQELEEQLSDLAEMILSCADRRRAAGLRLQFDDKADLVELAQRKRNYLLCRARLGEDFNPWTWPDDRVYRNETVRPLPSDFQLDRKLRGDRARRLEEAVRIFGEAEREVRKIASSLTAMGYEVRRPHPNAQELRLRFRSKRVAVDLAVKCSANGHWRAEAPPAQNKTQARLLRRILREGALEKLCRDLAEAGW